MADRADDAIGLDAIERAAVRGWPALETLAIDGWLARFASGGSTRANTVAALAWSGGDLGVSIAKVEQFYRSRQAPPRFTITDVAAPSDLDARLGERGWVRGGDHVTMRKVLGSPISSALPEDLTVTRDDHPTSGWFDVYLSGVSVDRRGVAPVLVKGVPAPCVFVSAMRGGKTIASGLTVIDGALASVQCMATLPEARRSGAATAVLGAIEDAARAQGCRALYLQAESTNTRALSVYERFGFRVIGHYHTRTKPD